MPRGGFYHAAERRTIRALASSGPKPEVEGRCVSAQWTPYGLDPPQTTVATGLVVTRGAAGGVPFSVQLTLASISPDSAPHDTLTKSRRDSDVFGSTVVVTVAPS